MEVTFKDILLTHTSHADFVAKTLSFKEAERIAKIYAKEAVDAALLKASKKARAGAMVNEKSITSIHIELL